MNPTLKVLILEDNEDDAFFVVSALKKAGFEFESTRVERLDDFREEVSKAPDLVLADFSLPQFNALDALAAMNELDLKLPFVLISGKITERTAVRCIKAGASDYVDKNNLEMLGGAVRQALTEHAYREEKLQMERALAEREIKYRKLFEDSSEGIVLTDMTGIIVDCNRAFEDLLGYNREELLGERVFTIYRDEEKRLILNQMLEEHGVVENFELDFYTKDGKLTHGLVTVSTLNDDAGNPDRLLGLLRDISERVKGQKEMETIVAVNTAMRGADDNESLYPIVLDLLLDISGAQGAALELVNQINTEIGLEAAAGVWKDLAAGDLKLNENEIDEILESGAPIIWTVDGKDEFISGDALNSLQTVVCVPLVSGEIDIGLIWIGGNDESITENVSLVQVLANITADTIHRFNLNENNLRALQESRAVARISRTLNEQLDLEKVFSLIVEEAVRIVAGAHRAVIHLYDEDNQRLHAVAYSAMNGEQVTQKNLLNIRVTPKNEFDFGFLSEEDIQAASMISGKGVAGLVIKERQTINVIDAREDPRYLKTSDVFSTLSLVVSPIISGERPLGTLSVLGREAGAFDASVELLLENLCVQAATAIENARLLEAERQAREIAEAQTEISTLLNQSLELDEVLDIILKYAIRVFNATAANIILLEERKPRVHRHSGYEFLGDGVDEYTQHLADFISSEIEENDGRLGSSLVIPDTHEDTRWQFGASQGWVRSFASVPLIVGEEVIGVLNVDSKRSNTFGEREMQLFQVFANNAASAVNNARLYEDLEKSLLTEQATRARLIRSDKLAGMGRMVASVAHELNNPLQTVKNCLFLIEQSSVDPEAAEILDLGMSEVERLTGIVNRLREVYRPSSDKEYLVTALRPLLADLEMLLETHLRRNKVELVIKENNLGGSCVRGFADRLKQVFLNLSLNGIEAMQPGGGTLVIRLLENKKEKEIGIAFVDEGMGINPMDMTLIFDPFYTTKDTGMGLGLSICYDIVQDHSGSIIVENNEDTGATFTVWLPLSDDNQNEK
jgi:PAS domain S-box-containing protein